MILFVNVKITSDFLTYYERGLLPYADRAQVFRYAMASLAVIPWRAVHLYVEFDSTQIQYRDAVLADIRQRFPGAKLTTTRLAHQRDWQAAIAELDAIDDELVWFLCNDDHVFVDSSLDTVLAVEQHLLRLRQTNPYVSCPFSHWPEHIAMFAARDHRAEAGHIVAPYASCDSVQIVSKDILRHWWFSTDYGDAVLPRTDWGRCVNIDYPQPGLGVLPLTELVRHYDGYSHVGLDLNICPPLFIPPGFFEKSMRLQFGGMPAPGVVLLDPRNPHSSAAERSGADLHGTVEQMPLFWRDATAEIRMVRPATDEDRSAAETAYYRRAAAAFNESDGVFHFAALLDTAGQARALGVSKLMEIQSQVNRSRMNTLRLNGCWGYRVPYAQPQPALSILVEDLDCRFAASLGGCDFSAARATGAELVWIGTGKRTAFGNIMKAMRWSDAASFQERADFDARRDIALEIARAEFLICLPVGLRAMEHASLAWTSQLSPTASETLIRAAIDDCDLVLLTKGAPATSDLGAHLIGVVVRRQIAMRLLSVRAEGPNVRFWEHLLAQFRERPGRVKFLPVLA